MSQTEVQLIKDAVIVNADVSGSAAIDVSKISGAMPLAGGTFTDDVTFDGATAGRDIVFDRSDNALEFADNARLRLGASNDLELLHDGTDSIINNATANLFIRSGSLHLQSLTAENMVVGEADGGVELYYDNSKILETQSWGVDITGTVEADQYNLQDSDGTTQQIRIGAAGDLRLYHTGSDSVINQTTQNDLEILHGTDTMAKFVPDAAVELYYDNEKMFQTNQDGSEFFDSDNNLNIYFTTNSSTRRGYIFVESTSGGKISFYDSQDHPMLSCTKDGAVDLYHDNVKMIETTSTGTSMPDGKFAKFGASDDITIGHNTSNYITYTGADFLITGDNTNQVKIMPRSDEPAAVFKPNAAVELYYDNTKRLETLSDGAQCKGVMHVMSEDGNVIQTTQAFYYSIGTNTTATFTLTSLIGSGRFVAGGYANAGQGALAVNIMLGGAMFATQHYNVNELQTSGMQNISVSTTKNNTSYVVTIANGSSSSTIGVSGFLESTGNQMGLAIA